MAFFLFSYLIHAQNLIPNPGFEEIMKCPTALKQLEYAAHWQKANAGSPELFHSCGLTASTSPFRGEGMAGVIFHTGYAGFVEYLQVELIDTLLPGQSYCFAYQIRLAENSAIAINKIGAHFGKSRLYSPNSEKFKVSPQVIVENVVDNSSNWQKIEINFTAKGGERYLTLGNFFDKHFIQEKLIGEYHSDWVSYYYIDEVELYASDGDCSIIEREEQPVSVKESILEHTVYFDKDEYQLSEKEKYNLEAFLMQLPETLFQPLKIEGHTDSDASFEYNLNLSQRRTEEVEKIMKQYKLNNIYKTWKGELLLAKEELSEKDKALNRRVEIKIVKE